MENHKNDLSYVDVFSIAKQIIFFTTFVKTQVSYDNGKTKNFKKAERLYSAADC